MEQQQTQNMKARREEMVGSALPFMHSVDDKRAKQEKYRRELMEQMAAHQQKEKSASTGPLGRNRADRGHDGFTSALPMGSSGEEDKRTKQERYRRELMQQMKEQEITQKQSGNRHGQQNRGDHCRGQSTFYEQKEIEENHDDQKQQYAMQLEEQMRLRKLTEVAEKERQLLEDKKMVYTLHYIEWI